MGSVGILTSGGDAPGMNAAVRAVFRALKMRQPEREIVFFRDGFRGLASRLDSEHDRNVDRRAVRDILHRGGTFLGTGRVPELIPPGPDDGPERQAAHEAFLQVASVNLFQMGVSDLIVIGGDGSFRGAQLIARSFERLFPQRPFRVIGIPATIDNDIWGTDFSIGYDTALNNVVDAIRKIRDTVESHRRAIVLEVMGNRAGWLALQCAIAGGAATVAIPEIEASWSHDDILMRVESAVRRDYRYFILVVAEGVLRLAGQDWMRTLVRRIEHHPGIIAHLGGPMEARINSVGHVARGGSPSAFDNTLAAMFGAAAADAIQTGLVDGAAVEAGHAMIGCNGTRMVTVPLEEVVRRSPRLVTESSPLWRLSTQLTIQTDQPF
jgi:6-phosphofructokinase 1